ncbi:hypothetical protein CCGE525_34535 (plasmid) [Rhizobium jaguaris]|uniref:Uncharacterized protein n=1 Tax=Rhizobium jaguaris TaxID=1312183 RepID=A0A387G7U7_9HYPH|nr:hypothetical protein CCGE525_34535 [Rhizobium jaguaris]
MHCHPRGLLPTKVKTVFYAVKAADSAQAMKCKQRNITDVGWVGSDGFFRSSFIDTGHGFDLDQCALGKCFDP